jgi:hypothetical protein
MYKRNLVAVVKCNGKIMRENGEEVKLPFGQEYSILIKNLQSRKAEVKVSIDGEDVLDGHSLLVNGNSEIELERFVKDLDEGNKFKFIQKTQKIQEHRGDKVDDGIIRIEFRYEKDKPINIQPVKRSGWNDILYDPPQTTWPKTTWDFNPTDIRCGCSLETSLDTSITTAKSIDTTLFSGSSNTVTTDNIANNYTTNLTNAISELSLPNNDEGITTKGSISNQQFKYGSIGELEENSYVITLQLKGYTESGEVITEPITVKTPIICPICGTNNKNTHKFCMECGTYLK